MAAVLVSVAASAQQNAASKRLESNFQLGGGLFLESGYLAREENPGAVLRLSYGLDIRFNDQWSVMPGVGLRAQLSQIDHFMAVGNDPDGMSLADVFVTARYHFESDGTRMVVGLGPALSIMTSADTYYVDADPSDPLDGKEKFKRYDLGLQPSITFLRGKHFQWGFEGSIGLHAPVSGVQTNGVGPHALPRRDVRLAFLEAGLHSVPDCPWSLRPGNLFSFDPEIIRDGCESVQEELTPDAMLHLIRCCFRRVRSSFHTCRCTVGSVP